MLGLSHDKKSHVMKAVASLAKFTGRYDIWLDIIRRFQLKWSNGNKGIKVFNSIFQNEGNNYSSMLKLIKDVAAVLLKTIKM
ncbi:MAG: hypothetical protein M3Q77_02465 [Thermoproteota archaeon]|nr:hypothetical protein [Thermoproteota archaeon]